MFGIALVIRGALYQVAAFGFGFEILFMWFFWWLFERRYEKNQVKQEAIDNRKKYLETVIALGETEAQSKENHLEELDQTPDSEEKEENDEQETESKSEILIEDSKQQNPDVEFSLESIEENVFYCPNCHKQVEAGDNFCKNCARKLNWKQKMELE